MKLSGTVLLLARLENGRHFRGKLHLLSTTGGLMQLDAPMDEGINVEVLFHVGDTTVRSGARLLFPMWATRGFLQPFEFQGMQEQERSRLADNVQALLAYSAASAFPPEKQITEIFSRSASAD